MITPDKFCQWSSVDEEKRKPVINEVILERYLTQEGFRCMYDDANQSDIRMVRIVDKRVRKSGTNAMYRFLVDTLEKGYEDWLQPLKAYRVFLFAPTIIQMVRIEPELLRDTAIESFIPFDNGIVSIDNQRIVLKKYADILTGDTCILNDKIIHRNIDLTCSNYKKGSWYKFCENAVGKEGIDSLMKSIGFMLHTYKDKSNAKMVVFADAAHTDNPNAMGGSGKSLIAFNSLREIRSLHWEDGKLFNPKDTFKFQGLTSEHDIACLDDIQKGFNQEVLYNMITGNFSSQEKYKSRKVVDFQDSSKFILTGNFGFSMGGDSDKRRGIVIGFTDHYNSKNQPINEFKHRFFEDWVGSRSIEYQYFYNFMFDCIRMYLEYGMESYLYDEVVKKGIINVSYSNTLLQAIHSVKHEFVGEKNAMRNKDWFDKVGMDDPNTLTVLRKVMEAEGYIVEKGLRKRIGDDTNASQLYYFKKR